MKTNKTAPKKNGEVKVEQVRQPDKVWNEDFANEQTKIAADEFQLEWNVKELSAWWKKFYLATGHKRLARLMLEATK